MSFFEDDDNGEEDQQAVAAFLQQQKLKQEQHRAANSNQPQSENNLLDSLFGGEGGDLKNGKGKKPGAAGCGDDQGPRHLTAFAAARDVRRQDKEQLALSKIAVQNAAEQLSEDKAALRKKDREMGVFRTRGYVAATAGKSQRVPQETQQRARKPAVGADDGDRDDQEEDYSVSLLSRADPAHAAMLLCAQQMQQQQQQQQPPAGSLRCGNNSGSANGRLIPVVQIVRDDDDDAAEEDNAGGDRNGPSRSAEESDDDKLARLSKLVADAKLRKKEQRAMRRATPEELAAARAQYLAAQAARLQELSGASAKR